ncbi:MAG: MATE family efflux transporter [Fusobacteriaceae bacterium]
MYLNDLTKGNITKILIALALPIIGTSFLQMTYGLVDMLWIGKIGSPAVAAIGTATFFLYLGEALNSILVTGSGIKISHNIGKKDYLTSESYICNAFFLNFILSIIYILFIFIFKNQLINLFNIKDILVEENAKNYLLIAGIGLVFQFNNFLFVRILNSFGESRIPFKINAIGVILNIILDPLFIFTFNLGVVGAAFATIFSQGISFYLFIKVSKKYFSLNSIFKFNYNKIKEILVLGFPSGIQRVLFTVFSIIIGRMVSQYGPQAIAAQKIGVQIESLSYMTANGLYGAIASFIGQNYGAFKNSRIIKGYKISIILATFVGFISMVLFMVFPRFLIEFFVKDEKTILLGESYLRILGISQIFMCIEIVTGGAFTGIGKPKTPSYVGIIFTALRIPLAYFLEKTLKINAIWLSITITSILKGAISTSILYIYLNTLKKRTLKRSNLGRL